MPLCFFKNFNRFQSEFQCLSFSSLILSDEGEYVCPRCTVFGLEKEEVQSMIEQGFKFTDHNKEDEGYEVNSSIFKVTQIKVEKT